MSRGRSPIAGPLQWVTDKSTAAGPADCGQPTTNRAPCGRKHRRSQGSYKMVFTLSLGVLKTCCYWFLYQLHFAY